MFRLTVVDPVKYREFQAWSYRLHPHLADLEREKPLVPVGHVHCEASEIASKDVLDKHGLIATEI